MVQLCRSPLVVGAWESREARLQYRILCNLLLETCYWINRSLLSTLGQRAFSNIGLLISS